MYTFNDYLKLYWLNIKRFWNNSFYNFENYPDKLTSKYNQLLYKKNKTFNEEIWLGLLHDQQNDKSRRAVHSEVGPLPIWFIEFILFIPNIIIWPIIYTISDVFTRKPITQQKKDQLISTLEQLIVTNPELFDTIIHGISNQDIFQSINSKTVASDLYFADYEKGFSISITQLEEQYKQYQNEHLELSSSQLVENFLKEFKLCFWIRNQILIQNKNRNRDKELRHALEVFNEVEEELIGNSEWGVNSTIQDAIEIFINTYNSHYGDDRPKIAECKKISELCSNYIELISYMKNHGMGKTIETLRNESIKKHQWFLDDSILRTCNLYKSNNIESHAKNLCREKQVQILKNYINNPDNNGTKLMQYLQTNLSSSMIDEKIRNKTVKSKIEIEHMRLKKTFFKKDQADRLNTILHEKNFDEKLAQNVLSEQSIFRMKRMPQSFEEIYCTSPKI